MGKIAEKEAKRSQLRDIHDVIIDTRKPCRERIKDYISQIGSPYCYLDDGVMVEIGFADTQISLQDRLISYISGIGQDSGNLR